MGKYFKLVFTTCLALVLSTIITACSFSFGSSTKVFERQWDKALELTNNYTVNVDACQGDDSANLKIVVDGTKAKLTTTINNGTPSTEYFNYEEGRYYHYFVKNNIWVKQEASQQYYNSMIYKFTNQELPYSSFTYNDNTHTYSADELTIWEKTFAVNIKFVEKQLSTIEFDSNEIDYYFTYTYSETSVTIPEISTQTDLSATEWNTAFTFPNQYTSRISGRQNSMDVILDITVHDYKVKLTYTNPNNSGSYDNYLDYTEDTYYGYSLNTQTNKWQKHSITEALYNQQMFKISASDVPYSSFTYNKSEDEYYAENFTLWNITGRVTIKFNYKVLREIRIENSSSYLVASYIFTNTTVTLPEIPVDTNPKEVTESTWASALNPDCKYIMTQEMLDATAISYKDGNNIKQTVLIDGYPSTKYAQTDGTNYYYYQSDENNRWAKEETDKDDFEENTNTNLASFFKFSEFTFNTTNNKYEAFDYLPDNADPDAQPTDYISIEFTDGKVVAISWTQEALSCNITYDYTTDFVVTLPTIGSVYVPDLETPGYILSENEWYDALAHEEKYSIKSRTTTGPSTITGTTYVDNNIVKSISHDITSGITNEQYAELDNDTCWVYTYNIDTMLWEKTETDTVVFDTVKGGYLTGFDFNEFTYNPNTGYYEAFDLTITATGSENSGELPQVTYEYILIKFDSQKRISRLSCNITNTHREERLYDYSDFTITLPNIDGELSEEEQKWVNALALKEDYVINMTQSAGSESVNMQIVVDGNKVMIYMPDDSSVSPDYLDYADNNYIVYSYNDNAWDTSSITLSEYNQRKYKFSSLDLPYTSFTYNSANDTYTAQDLNVWGMTFDVTIKMTNDKLSYILLSNSIMTNTLNYTYQDNTITLPSVNAQE